MIGTPLIHYTENLHVHKCNPLGHGSYKINCCNRDIDTLSNTKCVIPTWMRSTSTICSTEGYPIKVVCF